jgi:hypothetical protein
MTTNPINQHIFQGKLGTKIYVNCWHIFLDKHRVFNVEKIATINSYFSNELNKKNISLTGFPIVGFSTGIYVIAIKPPYGLH